MKTLLTIFATTLSLLLVLQLTAQADTRASTLVAEPAAERPADTPRQGVALTAPAPAPSLASPVDLILYDTLVDRDGGAFAMIAETGNDAAFIYQAGDILPDGSTLDVVTEVYVMVRNADGMHALEMLSKISMSNAEKAAIRDSLADSARSALNRMVSLTRR